MVYLERVMIIRAIVISRPGTTKNVGFELSTRFSLCGAHGWVALWSLDA